MSLNKKTYNGSYKGDAGYIAEEIIGGESTIASKCIVIRKTVEDGDFTLDEALHLYEVSKLDYTNYLVGTIFSEMRITLSALSDVRNDSCSFRTFKTQQHIKIGVLNPHVVKPFNLQGCAVYSWNDSHLKLDRIMLLKSVEILRDAYSIFVSPVDNDSDAVLEHFQDLSNKIKEGKI